MPEATILTSLTTIHQAMYDRMAAITVPSAPSLEFVGFSSSREHQSLPPVAVGISLFDLAPDPNRPLPGQAGRVLEPIGSVQSGDYNGVSQSWYDSYNARHPLPLILNYQIESWCHSAQTQLELDLAIMQAFPYKGVIDVVVGLDTFSFPIELVATANLDDLEENFRNRVYRYRVETWVESSIPDEELQTITSTFTEQYQSNQSEDLGDAQASELMEEVVEEQD